MMSTNNTVKIKRSIWGDDNPEKLKQTSSKQENFGQQLKSLVNPGNMLDQLLGTRPKEKSSSFKENKININTKSETLVFTRQNREEDRTVRTETEKLLKQLKEQVSLLEKSEKALTHEISKIKVEQLPEKTGIYYLRFFEWLIGIVHQLRIKVEEGRTWLAAFTSRKKKRVGYWRMYKKHGTTFGLSQERTLSTQTG